MAKRYTTVLTIAGSDSGGGAGIQADIKTCCANGVYCASVITALTAQNTMGVEAVEPVSAKMIEAQLHAVLKDFTPDAVKIGMLADIQSVNIVAEVLAGHQGIKNIVVDPVMVATSGHNLTVGDTTDALRQHLLPLATVVTPNMLEALVMADDSDCPDDFRHIASKILKHCNAVIIKGGHGRSTNGQLTDSLFTADGLIEKISHPFVMTSNTHGTGCSLSTAIACCLAKGNDLTRSFRKAVDWLQQALIQGQDIILGQGPEPRHGPVNHIWHNAALKDIE